MKQKYDQEVDDHKNTKGILEKTKAALEQSINKFNDLKSKSDKIIMDMT